MTEHRRLRQIPTWIAVATGLATVVLIAIAAADVVRSMSSIEASTSSTTETTTEAPVAAPTQSSPPTDEGPFSDVAVIATPCRPNSNNSFTADGSVAYCEVLQMTDMHMWSLYPGEIPMPPAVYELARDPAVAVCMVQTQRDEADCVTYLERPSNPGDGAQPT